MMINNTDRGYKRMKKYLTLLPLMSRITTAKPYGVWLGRIRWKGIPDNADEGGSR
jgi:hypothetical protein